MKNQELYNKTIGILVNAYLNGELYAADCTRCAVGNICMASSGHKDYGLWKDEYYSLGDEERWYDITRKSRNGLEVVTTKMIDSTGYSIKDLIKIEDAFMRNWRSGDNKEEDGFNSLMAVVDVLDTIHENTDAQITKEKKELFVKS